ncbi:unnamed protein product [Chironomus riparius]|uniref:Uncharacterized protein n=1 Tax=Chironomus riparius TaxID=315576 RepID=A0A9N9S649_9DIPT|nr:unnamed protein product [Chironomus riparius]
MEDLFWFIFIIVLASILIPVIIGIIVSIVIFVFVKKASDAHKRNRTPAPYVITQTPQPTTYSDQSNSQAFSNAAFDVEMNNQHQINHQGHMNNQQMYHQMHHQMHMNNHQLHMDMNNSGVNSQTTDIPPSYSSFQTETFSSPSYNDFNSDSKNDTSTVITSSDPI